MADVEIENVEEQPQETPVTGEENEDLNAMFDLSKKKKKKKKKDEVRAIRSFLASLCRD